MDLAPQGDLNKFLTKPPSPMARPKALLPMNVIKKYTAQIALVLAHL